ncbi:MAG: hypothetical protein EP297_08135 [Gammaproteobacteria bacterium]|nr:MAG: hypothetical protein EP297_08135 [Gammaproteobacteria bacterium]
MHGPSHLLISWFMAESMGLDEPRDRRLIALSGLAPDIDAVAYAGAIVWYGFDKDQAFINVWEVIHHRYTHGLGFILFTGIIVYLLVRKPSLTGSHVKQAARNQAYRVAGLAMLASLVHVFSDLVAGGPTWPVFPLWPITDQPWAVSWSFTLAQWPNTVILVSLLVAMMLYPKMMGYSPLESINYNLDRWFVHIIQHGSDHPTTTASGEVAAADSGKRSLIVRLLIYVILFVIIAAILIPLGIDTGQLNLPAFLE